MNNKIYETLTATIQMIKILLANADISLTDSQKIKVSTLYEDWSAGNHAVGEVYNANGQTWECYAAYDNAIYPDINPNNSAWLTFNRPLHGTTKDTARPFVHPTHSMDIYKKGEYMIWTDGTVRHCLVDTSYSPDEYAPAWEIVS